MREASTPVPLKFLDACQEVMGGARGRQIRFPEVHVTTLVVIISALLLVIRSSFRGLFVQAMIPGIQGDDHLEHRFFPCMELYR